MFRLDGQTAVVTGGASGIGLATVGQLAALGARIVIADLNAAAGEAEAGRLEAAGSEALFVRTNVAEAADVAALVAATLERFGGLEILMHFAGIGLEKSALATSLADWQRVISVNLTGSFLMMQAAGSVMVERGYGRIVSMASAAGLRGGTGRTAYGASKGGVIAMTQVMAAEWAKSGVTVNTLAPGGIETELVKKMHDAETRRAYLSRIPMDRYGTPDEVASAAVYLALPESRYLTGVTLAVDGGFMSSGVLKSGGGSAG